MSTNDAVAKVVEAERELAPLTAREQELVAELRKVRAAIDEAEAKRRAAADQLAAAIREAAETGNGSGPPPPVADDADPF